MKISERTSGVSLHFEKHKANDVGVNGLQRHNERVPGQRHKNENINDSRTKDNVFLKKSNIKFNKQVEDTIERKRKNGLKGVRKDAVRMVEATVQLSGKILDDSEEEQEKVLRNSYDWLKNKFGEDNVISAVIHKDETNMHLHFDFVPFTEENKLSAKEIVTKPKLHEYQQDFLKSLQKMFPIENFERGGGAVKGLKQRDFEKFQDLIKQQNDEITRRENTLEFNNTKQLKRESQFENIAKQQENRIKERAFKINQHEMMLDLREKVLKGSFKRLERERGLIDKEREKIDEKRSEAQNILNEAVEERKLVERLKNRLGNTWDNIVKAVRNGALRPKKVEQTIPKKTMTYEDISKLNNDLLELVKENKKREMKL